MGFRLNMNRSNSFVSSLKWWPLQGHNNNNNSNNNKQQQQHSNGLSSTLSLNKTTNFGSSVAVQKLRESKWFKRDEQRIFCAVVECGFIVEVRTAPTTTTTTTTTTNSFSSSPEHRSHHLHHNPSLSFALPRKNGSYSSNDDEDDDDNIIQVVHQEEDEEKKEQNKKQKVLLLSQDENELPISWFGIVLCKTAKDNKPKPETIEIFSVKIRKSGTFKMMKMSLEDIWSNGWELRINNFADKEKHPHCEKDIRNQVSFARKAKQSLWNNNKHFVYWCRYGSRQQDVRKRQMSECVKWGSVGMNAGMLLVMNKQKSLSASK